MKPSRVFNFAFLLVIVGFSLIIPARAATYLPAVTSGQWAEYKPLYNTCSGDPTLCQSTGNSIGDTDYGMIQVVLVYGSTVTLKLITVYKNGTGTQQGVMVNVETGVSNVTSLTGTPTDYFVLAGGLKAPDKIWNTPNAPTLNLTRTETVLGSFRMINFLNYTSSYGFGGFTTSISTGFAFDQESGVFIELSFSASSNNPYATYQEASAFGMVDNNIWLTSSLPDFTLSADPATVNTSQNSPGTSTIAVTRTNGFSATVKLTVQASPDGIACSFSSSSLSSGGSDTSTLSCSGSPGTYNVAVTGDSGYSTHTASITMNVAGSTNPDFTISSSGPISFQTGSSGSSTITLTAQNGFSSTINLAVTTPSGLSCSLSKNSLPGYGSSTLTCTGQPGTYTVTVEATSGSTRYSMPLTVNVSNAPASSQPSTNLPMILIFAGIGIVAIVAVLVAYVLLRRKPAPPAVAPSETMPPATPA